MDNFYLGSTEYIIRFHNGTHVIADSEKIQYYPFNAGIVFTGTYEQCKAEQKRMEIEYKESLL